MSPASFIARVHLAGLVLCLGGVIAPACSSQPAPQALPPQTMAPPPPAIEEPISNIPTEPAPEAGSTAADESASVNEAEAEIDSGPPDDEITVVIEQPAEQEGQQPTSLFAAAQAERARRARAGESKIILTDKNLKEHAAAGQVTFVEESEDDDGASSEEATQPESERDLLEETAADEAYWRGRVSDIRRAWREAVDRIDELEDRIAALRHDFYAEDDPFYRDSQIKPAWDRAIEELEETRRRARTEQDNLADALDEGRRAGALPGWLRDGLDLEPTPDELEELGADQPSDDRFHQPSEPVVLEEGEEGPGTDGPRRR